MSSPSSRVRHSPEPQRPGLPRSEPTEPTLTFTFPFFIYSLWFQLGYGARARLCQFEWNYTVSKWSSVIGLFSVGRGSPRAGPGAYPGSRRRRERGVRRDVRLEAVSESQVGTQGLTG